MHVPLTERHKDSPTVCIFACSIYYLLISKIQQGAEIQLILEKNAISHLPLELFMVVSLTVLNLSE